MRIGELQGCKVALWGFGREGRATLRWLHRRLPDMAVTVLNDTPLTTNTDISEKANVRYLVGEDAMKAIPRFDIIIKSPGISMYRSEVRKARAQGVQFTSATQIWFDEHPNVKTICITGTKGKSTTASLIFEMLRQSGVNVMLGGNIGVPLLSRTDYRTPPEIMVIELSSYQICDLKIVPSIALLLNLFPEHLDWHGDKATYFNDKLALFNHIADQNIIINHTDPITRQFSHHWPEANRFNHPDGFHTTALHIRRASKPFFNIDRVRLPGPHNLSNICAALTVMEMMGMDVSECTNILADFRGLPHRLQIVEEKNDVLFVDDSISTVPEATIAAIQSFQGRMITLLVGGFDRKLPLKQFAVFLINQPVFAVITIPPSGIRLADEIRIAWENKPNQTFTLYEAKDLEEAMSIARKITPKQGVVLLSPAAPSYGAFKNFEQRGRFFTALARQY